MRRLASDLLGHSEVFGTRMESDADESPDQVHWLLKLGGLLHVEKAAGRAPSAWEPWLKAT